MKVSLEPKINDDPELLSKIEAANKLLEDLLGPSADQVEADWSLSDRAKGHFLVNLTVSDWTGSVGYRFAPEELRNSAHMRMRLHRLWGDLLQVRSHVQIDENWWALQGQGEH